MARLTKAERRVLVLIVDGHTRTEMAEKLSVSARTIDTHREHIRKKFGLVDRRDLVWFWKNYKYSVASDMLENSTVVLGEGYLSDRRDLVWFWKNYKYSVASDMLENSIVGLGDGYG